MAHQAPLPTRSSRRRFRTWTTFLTLCALLGLGKPVFDLHWKNRQTLYGQAAMREQVTRQQVRAEIWNRLYAAYGRSPADIEAVLGLRAGALADIAPVGRSTRVLNGAALAEDPSQWATDDVIAGRWIVPVNERLGHDAAGWVITLNFVDARFSGGAASPPAATKPPSPVFRNAIDVITRAALFAGPIAWFGGLLAAVAERPRRGSRFADFAMAGALAGTVAWAVHPGAHALPSMPGFVGLAVGAVSMLIARRTYRWLRRLERSRDQHRCVLCDYDLTGNVSGICPECGTETYEGRRRQRAADAAAAADSVGHVVLDDDGDQNSPEHVAGAAG